MDEVRFLCNSFLPMGRVLPDEEDCLLLNPADDRVVRFLTYWEYDAYMQARLSFWSPHPFRVEDVAMPMGGAGYRLPGSWCRHFEDVLERHGDEIREVMSSMG